MTDPTTTTDASPDDEIPIDGRNARATRTRAAIVDAVLDLVQEGDLRPTANRIASRAGTSLRLIYHHFGDLDSLFRAAAARQADRVAARIRPIDPGLPLADRVDAIVEQRADILEWVTPVRMASMLHEPFSEELRTARVALARDGEARVARLFATELDRLEGHERTETRAAVTVVLSWGFWNDLRTTGRSVDEARAVLHRAVTALVGLDDRR